MARDPMERQRLGRKLLWVVPSAILALVIIVVLARWMRELPSVQAFITTYPGATETPKDVAPGMPAWLRWQHFFNMFLVVMVIQSGWKIRTVRRPAAQWTRNNSGLLRTKNPPKKISLEVWFHLSLDALWLLNGLAYVVMLFASGHWSRVVPTSWDVFPNALSTALQYASLNWPLESSWTNYNGLQMLSYFVTVFVAAPLAAITGVRMSGLWPTTARRLNKIFPIDLARTIHFPVMLYFVLFIVAHVTLVFSTGVFRNLNHMYNGSDDHGWAGFIIFAVSIVVVATASLLARPAFLRPVAALTGKLSRN